MESAFVPTQQDVERYRNLRALSMDLHHRMLNTVPRQAYEEIGDAIGVRRNGILVFDTEDMSAVMADCCLYDWYRDGRNLVQRYPEAHRAEPGTDEDYILRACAQARYRILVVQSAVLGAGLYCEDILNDDRLFLMDLAFSRTLAGAPTAIATRTVPLGDYWMTTGAALPIDRETDAAASLRQLQAEHGEALEGPRLLPLGIVRACLAAGAAEHIVYAAPQAPPRKARREPRWPGFKRRRH